LTRRVPATGSIATAQAQAFKVSLNLANAADWLLQSLTVQFLPGVNR
jgi:hypothetical protein